MNITSPGQIYLADQRGLTENDTLRRFSTLNYESHYNEHRKPVGRLSVLNDEMLAAGKSIRLTIEKTTYLIIIPITGEVVFKNYGNQISQIDVGEVYISYQSAGSFVGIENGYEADFINFLHLQIQADETTENQLTETFNFNFDNKQNQLISIIPEENKAIHQALPFSVYIGRFDGRNDGIFKIKHPESLLFSFVIAGAFEMQGRLMHERDGLALWDLHEADLEALSNNAIMLIIELKK